MVDALVRRGPPAFKTESERFYRDHTPRADAIYDEYVREIEQERQRTTTRGGPER